MRALDDEGSDEIDRLFRALRSVAPPRGFARLTIERSREARRQLADERRNATWREVAILAGLVVGCALVGWQIGTAAAIDLRLVTRDPTLLFDAWRDIAALLAG